MTPEQAFAEAMKFENRPNPYPLFDEMRKTPVARVAHGIYVVTGYKEIIALAHDPRVSSDLRNSSVAARMRAGDGSAASSDMDPTTAEMLDKYGGDNMMILSDPPDHSRMRRQAMRHFGPPHCPDLIPSMEEYCVRIVNDLLDKLKGKHRFDVVDDYAYPLPVAVICKILGVPLEDEKQFHIWIAEFLGGMDLGPEAATEEGKRRQAKGIESRIALTQYLIGLVERAERGGGEGMIAELVHDTGPDGRMSSSEILKNCILLLVAGHDSTVNLLTHCVLTLLRNPGSIDRLRQRPELIPRAIEEVLRLESSVQFFPSRSALSDIEIAGTTIPKGAPIFLMYSAGNRDPAQFADPNTFSLERSEKETLGWGASIHVCFGGPLARLEVNVGIETFLRRVRNPRLVVDPPPYRPSQIFRGPLHCEIDIDGIEDRAAS